MGTRTNHILLSAVVVSVAWGGGVACDGTSPSGTGQDGASDAGGVDGVKDMFGTGGGAGDSGLSGSGGMNGSGGSGSGGVKGSGGAAGSGGAQGSGGVKGSGGVVGSGGVKGAGGVVGSGGAHGSGGALAPVTLYIAGDSTVADVSSATPTFFGWGQQMAQNFNNVTVVNRAIGGRSIAFWMYQVARDSSGAYLCVDTVGNPQFVTDASGNKVDTSQWAAMKSAIKTGDYFMVAFGANDATNTCPRHVGITDYKAYLGIMAAAIQAKGAHPIFVTPASQLSGCSGASGTPKATLTAYATAVKEQGAALGVPVIDLNTLSVQYYQTVGCASIYTVFTSGQSTHFTQPGAVAIAGLVADALVPLQSPLAAYLK